MYGMNCILQMAEHTIDRFALRSLFRFIEQKNQAGTKYARYNKIESLSIVAGRINGNRNLTYFISHAIHAFIINV